MCQWTSNVSLSQGGGGGVKQNTQTLRKFKVETFKYTVQRKEKKKKESKRKKFIETKSKRKEKRTEIRKEKKKELRKRKEKQIKKNNKKMASNFNCHCSGLTNLVFVWKHEF